MRKYGASYTPDQYIGMTTVAGFSAAGFVLSGRFTQGVQAASQVLTGLILVASLVSCMRMYDAIARGDGEKKGGSKAWRIAITVISAALILFAIIVVNVIPIMPLLAKGLVTGLGVIIWLRLQMKFLSKGSDVSES